MTGLTLTGREGIEPGTDWERMLLLLIVFRQNVGSDCQRCSRTRLWTRWRCLRA
jgi:hypothetical protein